MSLNENQGAGSSTMGYVDSATDCAICLSSLVDEKAITLKCGHRWHLRCIKEQLKHAVPNPAKRLLFSGCRCAKCGAFCDHPELADVLHGSAELREAVDNLVTEQMAVDGITNHPEGIAYGRSVYAFYLCGVCKKPYFGGTVACADATDELLPVAARVCAKCSPAASAACNDPSHTGYYEWKCRFCCKTATHVCYGSTHFCDECHDRNGERLRQYGSERAPPIDAIPCPGRGVCNVHMRDTQTHHENGPSHSAECVLRCTLCASDPLGAGLRIDDANVSANMVYNGDASLGVIGWVQGNRDRWRVEDSEIRFHQGQRNFVSSHVWADMVQVVNLNRYLARPGLARLQVSARYMGRTDCPSVFRMSASVYDERGNELSYMESDTLNAPQDFWESVHLRFEPNAAAAWVAVAVHGRDGRGWAGEYGSKVTDVSIRVLFDGSHASRDEIMLAGSELTPVHENSGRAREISHRFFANHRFAHSQYRYYIL